MKKRTVCSKAKTAKPVTKRVVGTPNNLAITGKLLKGLTAKAEAAGFNGKTGWKRYAIQSLNGLIEA